MYSTLKFKCGYFECISESCPPDYLFTADNTAVEVKVNLIACFADIFQTFPFVPSVDQFMNIFKR